MGTNQNETEIVLLWESDVFGNGSSNNFMVWDASDEVSCTWNTSTLSYYPTTVQPSLTGTFAVTLAERKTIECKPVWQLLVDVVREWTPEKAGAGHREPAAGALLRAC